MTLVKKELVTVELSYDDLQKLTSAMTDAKGILRQEMKTSIKTPILMKMDKERYADYDTLQKRLFNAWAEIVY